MHLPPRCFSGTVSKMQAVYDSFLRIDRHFRYLAGSGPKYGFLGQSSMVMDGVPWRTTLIQARYDVLGWYPLAKKSMLH